MAALPENCNYVEYIVKCANGDIGLDQADFNAYMSRMKSHKYFKRESKCYCYDNMIYENSFFNEIRVSSKNPISIEDKSKYHVCYYTKEKQPYHAFPSTHQINAVYYSKKLVFRLHNRVYINFETMLYPQKKETIYKIYINYNHDKGVDMDSVNQIISSTIASLALV